MGLCRVSERKCPEGLSIDINRALFRRQVDVCRNCARSAGVCSNSCCIGLDWVLASVGKALIVLRTRSAP